MNMTILRFRWTRGIEYQWVSGVTHARSPVYQSKHECIRRAVDHARRYGHDEFILQIYDVLDSGDLQIKESRHCL